MDFEVIDKTALTSVDRSADYLLIYDASASALKRSNVNSLNNLTSHPVGVDDVQTLTQKTLDNTNTLTMKDTLFTLQDDGDATKQAKFQLSGITTATTRTYTLPNASSTLVDLSSSQTLTGKTLTSPTINTATIVNPTITADSISEYTSGVGVTIDGVLLKDSLVTKTALANAWPVGAVFISVVSTNPATLLGFGTWVAFATGRMLIGLDAGDTDFDTVEETGGAKTHTHNLSSSGYALISHISGTGITQRRVSTASYTETHTGTSTISGTSVSRSTGTELGGATDSGSTLPPYIAVYMFKRTA